MELALQPKVNRLSLRLCINAPLSMPPSTEYSTAYKSRLAGLLGATTVPTGTYIPAGLLPLALQWHRHNNGTNSDTVNENGMTTNER